MTKIVTNRNKRNKEYSNNETMLLITMIKLMMVIIIIGKKGIDKTHCEHLETWKLGNGSDKK